MEFLDENIKANLPVTENKFFTTSTISFCDGSSHEIMLKFDKIYKKRMRLLIEFMKKISIQQNKYGITPETCKNFEDTEYSFLGTSESVVSQMFYILFKDELCEQTSNFALDELCKFIAMDDETSFYNNDEYSIIKHYTEELVKYDFNDILIGQLNDFFISIWSCFEASINSLTSSHENNIKKELEDSRYKDFIILCSNLNENVNPFNNNDVERNKSLFLKSYPVYIGIQNRLDYLYKNTLTNYKRNKKYDKATLRFAGALRNTMHNNGIHSKSEIKHSINNIDFVLEKNKRFYLSDFSNILVIVNEIFDVYCEILECITTR